MVLDCSPFLSAKDIVVLLFWNEFGVCYEEGMLDQIIGEKIEKEQEN
jgi:hypothetical protein